LVTSPGASCAVIAATFDELGWHGITILWFYNRMKILFFGYTDKTLAVIGHRRQFPHKHGDTQRASKFSPACRIPIGAQGSENGTIIYMMESTCFDFVILETSQKAKTYKQLLMGVSRCRSNKNIQK